MVSSDASEGVRERQDLCNGSANKDRNKLGRNGLVRTFDNRQHPTVVSPTMDSIEPTPAGKDREHHEI